MHLIELKPVELKDALTLLAAVVAVAIGLFQYYHTSRGEFLKPIREKQLQLYVDASAAAATLATAPQDSDEWKKANFDFLRLYYGPLAMFEDYRHQQTSQNPDQVTVEQAMIAFKKCLDDPSCSGSNDMYNLSLALAHTCRVSLGTSWGFEAKQLEGDYQRMILEKQPK